MCLYWTEYNEVNMSHSDIQKYISFKNGINSFKFSCTGSHKILWTHYVLYLQMSGRIFSIELCVFLYFINSLNKQCLCIWFVCLFVRPSIRALSNSRKYSSNVLKFMYVTHIWYRMNRIENGTNRKKCSFTEAHKKFSDTLRLNEGKIFKTYFNLNI